MNVSEGLDLRARLRVIRRRMVYFVAGLTLSMVVGAIVCVRSPRVYRAVATVFIDANAPEVLSGVREVYDLGTASHQATREYYATQYNIIKSRLVAERVVETLGLSPQLLLEALENSPNGSNEARLAGDPLSDLPELVRQKFKMLGLDKIGSRDELLAKLKKFDSAGFLQKRTIVFPIRDSRLAQVEVEDTDPALAASIANAVVDAYIEVNLDQKIDATRSAVTWLTNQMQQLKQKVTDSEQQLYAFRKENNIVSVSMEDRQSMISETLTSLNSSLSQVKAQGFSAASRRDALQRALQRGDLVDGASDSGGNGVLQKLYAIYADLHQEEAQARNLYTEQHPRVVALREKISAVRGDIEREIRKGAASSARDYEIALQTQRRLETEIDRTKAEALELGKKEVEYGRLKRDRDNNLALYDVVLKREKEANLTQMLKVNNVRKLDAARPPVKPVRPNIPIILLSSLMLGTIGSIVLVFLIDYLDNTVKSQDQIEKVIGLPFLGIAPRLKFDGIKKLSSAEKDLFVAAHPQSVSAECWRTVRTNVMFMSPDKPAKHILVTSSVPLEGKSITSINMAVTMALLGARTIIIDSDMRRPRLHRSFGVTNDRGLSSIILGEQSIEEAVRATTVPNLDVLTCGPVPPNPAEILHSKAFQDVFAQLGTRYERIIFDSPPVGAVADALVLASMVDGIILVAKAGASTWQATLRTRLSLEDVGGRLYGLVLNDVDLSKRADGEYYYYRNYRYNYAPLATNG